MTPVNRCNYCRHACQVSLTDVYCVHKDNFSKPVNDYQINTDAGFNCPLNKIDPNYIPWEDQLSQYQQDIANGLISESEDFTGENIPIEEDIGVF